MNHDNDYHDDINYGNRFPDGWYYNEAYEDFRLSNKLTVEMLDELLSFSKGTRDNLEQLTRQRLDD